MSKSRTACGGVARRSAGRKVASRGYSGEALEVNGLSEAVALQVSVLLQFIEDIEIMGVERTSDEWPDIVETYRDAKSALAFVFERYALCRCDSCGKVTFSSAPGAKLEDVPRLGERLDPGSIVPEGECPRCGALTYPLMED